MATKFPIQSEVFLDSSYAIALSAAKDEYHDRAFRLARQVQLQKVRLVTTHAVLLEIGNALSRKRYRSAAIRLLVSLERDPTVEIIPLTESLYAEALILYQNRSDKEWGMTDCVSFVVMRERKLKEALTADQHFTQAGIRALLLEEVP
jgi:uncharacterized protein